MKTNKNGIYFCQWPRNVHSCSWSSVVANQQVACSHFVSGQSTCFNFSLDLVGWTQFSSDAHSWVFPLARWHLEHFALSLLYAYVVATLEQSCTGIHK